MKRIKLHENKELFQDAITDTSQQKGIAEIYIGKKLSKTDLYWKIFVG